MTDWVGWNTVNTVYWILCIQYTVCYEYCEFCVLQTVGFTYVYKLFNTKYSIHSIHSIRTISIQYKKVADTYSSCLTPDSYILKLSATGVDTYFFIQTVCHRWCMPPELDRAEAKFTYIYIHIYIYIYICIYMCIYAHTRASTHTRTYTWALAIWLICCSLNSKRCLYIGFVYIDTYCMYAHMYTCACTRTRTRTCVLFGCYRIYPISACACVHIYSHIYTICMYEYTISNTSLVYRITKACIRK